MAITRTTLASAITSVHDLAFTLTSNTGATVGGCIRVNGEWAFVVELLGSTGVKVRHRGANGSVAKTHAALSPVVLCLASDHADKTLPEPDQDVDVLTYAADGAIALPTKLKTRAYINKATAAALTLASPTTTTPDGAEIEFVSFSAAAHTITYTPGFRHDTTLSDVATFAATKGGVFVIQAMGGLWVAKSLSGVTLA